MVQASDCNLDAKTLIYPRLYFYGRQVQCDLTDSVQNLDNFSISDEEEFKGRLQCHKLNSDFCLVCCIACIQERCKCVYISMTLCKLFSLIDIAWFDVSWMENDVAWQHVWHLVLVTTGCMTLLYPSTQVHVWLRQMS